MIRYFGILLLIFLAACEDTPEDTGVDLTDITYNPVEYVVEIPSGFPLPAFNFPPLPIPEDNPLTRDGVELGRRLFYDPILSADSTQSCGSCHFLEQSFTDGMAVSEGIDGISGTRSSMSLLNIAYAQEGLFWDGRAASLEEQALLPVEDPIELHHNWDDLEVQLQNSTDYRTRFRQAFGIENSKEITRDLAAKAIAQFERTMVSSGTSKYDRVKRGELSFTDEELLGESLFFDDDPDVPDAECSHCHQIPLFTTNEFKNNGLDEVASLADFPDKGLGEVTGNQFDNGKFRIPTLRNIEFTAPYMHDGRFATLEEVMDHYNSGGHFADNVEPIIRPLELSDEQKVALIAFMKTLSDEVFLEKEEYSNPFE